MKTLACVLLWWLSLLLRVHDVFGCDAVTVRDVLQVQQWRQRWQTMKTIVSSLAAFVVIQNRQQRTHPHCYYIVDEIYVLNSFDLQ
jgi:hypothetical protein